MTDKEFFETYGDYHFRLGSFGVETSLSVEDLYQHLKSRLMAELAVQASDLRTLGVLVERPEE